MLGEPAGGTLVSEGFSGGKLVLTISKGNVATYYVKNVKVTFV